MTDDFPPLVLILRLSPPRMYVGTPHVPRFGNSVRAHVLDHCQYTLILCALGGQPTEYGCNPGCCHADHDAHDNLSTHIVEYRRTATSQVVVLRERGSSAGCCPCVVESRQGATRLDIAAVNTTELAVSEITATRGLRTRRTGLCPLRIHEMRRSGGCRRSGVLITSPPDLSRTIKALQSTLPRQQIGFGLHR